MSLTATDIMTRNVICATPSDTVAGVARMLSDHDISALPICDASGTVVGMISEGDLIAPMGDGNVGKRSWWLNLLAEGADLSPSFLDYIKVENRSIRDLMVHPVITASPETSMPQLADMLTQYHIKRLPIIKDGKLVGIVSRADLIKAMSRTPDAILEAL